MNALEILRAARSRIADPSAWTQGAPARDASGREVESLSPDAVCWCSIGALASVHAGEPKQAWWDAYDAFVYAVGVYVAQWNDEPTTTHAMVLAKFDQAIRLVESAPGRKR